MAKRFAVWKIGRKTQTTEYVYANTHRDASAKYRAKHTSYTIHDVETQKV